MAYLEIKHLNFTYAGMRDVALQDVNLSVEQGDFVLLCGASGCGKTTFLRLLKRQLRPNGALTGDIILDGEPADDMDERRSVAEVGYVMQQPDAQIVTDKVWHELAFGLESLGESTSVIRRRVAEIAGFFGMGELYHKNTAELSGGQKQLLNLASIMVMQPRLLLLDEPTAQLDPIAAAEFLSSLKKINEELGVTVIIAEHRLEETFPLCDRVVLMDRTRIRTVSAPRALCSCVSAEEANLLGLPTAVRVFAALGGKRDCPLTVREGKRYIMQEFANKVDRLPEPIQTERETVLETRDVWFRYGRQDPDVLRGLDLSVKRGELFCILGGNGAGKTTLLRVLSGVARPYRGKVAHGKAGISCMPQDPRMLFLQATVLADWQDAAAIAGSDEHETAERIHAAAELLNISHLAERHPYDLSGGEVQKAAMVKLLLNEPNILLLDEPTKGLDAASKAQLAAMLAVLKQQDKTVVMVTHDVEFAAEHADRCAMFFDGQIVAVEPRVRFFAQNNFYTTAASRMSRSYYQNAVTANMLIELCRQNEKKEDV